MAISLDFHKNKITVGDIVRVHYKIIEKDVVAGKTKKEKHEETKERTQAFEGMVIAIRGRESGKSFVVRRIGVQNIGIERIFPVISPWIKRIEVVKHGDVRRAKLYYLREKTRKEIARIGSSEAVAPEIMAVTPTVPTEKVAEVSKDSPVAADATKPTA